ncbi:hypothetical protein MKX08_009224 [Trichoderma sp. CBMAI-0020]|nr:hypothetical protein MKX08_009224 [Trichoderma sp. CBMAI-0020]WOD45716.1 hypothetical protein [Trichoderma atroviride]
MEAKLRERWQGFAPSLERMDSQSERRLSSVWSRREQQERVRTRSQAVDAVIDKAYFMCFGQPSALSPTHTVITATLAMPLYGTGPITFPAVAKSSHQTIPTAISRETRSSISLPTTLVTDTTSLSKPRPSVTGSTAKPTATTTIRQTTKPSTTSFRSSTSSQVEILTTDPTGLAFTKTTSTTTETSTSTNVPDGIVGGEGEKKASASLSNGQVAGVAIGCIIGAGLIGVGIAIFCRLRRRRSQFGRKMRKDGRKLRDSWGPEKPNGGGGTDSWIVNQLRAPLDPGPVPTPTKSWYNRASWRPSAIGLAISPARTRDVTRATTPTSARPLSKLLPAKPVMGQGPPRLEVSLPSRDGDSHFGAVPFMATAAAGAASGAVMSGAMAASSSPKPAPLPKARPMAQPATREPTVTKQFTQTRNLTPPRIVIPPPSIASPRSKPQSPLLKLIIPKKGAFKPFVPIPVTNTRHDSSTTEFEEDGRTSLSPGGQIWRPPSADPLSAAPYYVADRNGNWRLGDPRRAQEIAELEASISPLTAAPRSAAPKLVAGLGLASGAAEALELVKAASRREATKAAAKIKAAEQSREDGLGIRMAPEKTIRAVEPSLSSDEEIQEQEQDQQPYAPRPLFSNNGNSSNTTPRRLSSHRRSSTRSLTRPRITSTDSGVTTFSTSTEDDAELRSPPGMEQLGSLSPVVESPRSLRPRRGQSPTQYPKIPASLNAAVPSSGDLNIEMATSKGGNAAVPSAEPATADRPAQKSPGFGAPLAAGTMSSNDDKTKQQGKRPMGSDAVGTPNAIRTGSPMMRMESSTSRPDERYQAPRSQTSQQPHLPMPVQPNASSRPYPPQQNQQYPAPAYQRPTGANNYHGPYRLPPHPSAYRPNIDSSGYPYQTRLPEFNQGPMTYNMPYAPQPNRYPHHHPRDHQPPFTQQSFSARPISQLPQQRRQPSQQQQQQQQQQPPRAQRYQRPPSLGRMPPPQQQHQQQQQQDFYFQQPSTSTSSHYPSDIPQGPLLTSTSTSSTDSQASSLLAKRLGTSRAANMALPVPQPITTSSSQNKWLRQGQQQQPSTPQMPPPPQQPAELPATPVWKPRLTPTRRGDDLYLIAR